MTLLTVKRRGRWSTWMLLWRAPSAHQSTTPRGLGVAL